MDIAADTGMMGAAAAAVVAADAAGFSTEFDALLAGLVAALVRIIVPELFALLRARLQLMRERTEKEIEDLTDEDDPAPKGDE